LSERVNFIFELTDRVNRPLRKIDKALKKFDKRTDKLREKMAKFGKTLTMSVTLPILAMGAAFIKTAKDINEAMARIATLIPDNLNRIKELKKGVQELSVETATGTGIMAEGLYEVVSAFGDTTESMERLRAAAIAARAGNATVLSSVKLLSTVTKGYGDISAKALKSVGDMSFITVKLGQTDFPELAASMGRVVPLAAKLNVQQKELFAGFATLTGVTGSAAEVSTQMAAILRAMLKPTEDLKKATRRLGFASAEQMINQKGLVESLKLLMKLTKGNGEATAKLFGRAEALTAVFALTGKSADAYTKKLKEMENATGAMNTAFRQQSEGINRIGFRWAQFKVRIAIMSQLFGEALLPALESLIDLLEPLIKFLGSLSDTTKTVIFVFAGLLALLGPLLMFFAALTKAVIILQVAMIPTILVIAKVIAIILVLVGLAIIIKTAWKPVARFFLNLWKNIKLIFTTAINAIKRLWRGFITWLKDTWKAIVDFFKRQKDKFINIGIAMTTAMNPLVGIPLIIMRNWEPIVGFFTALWKKVENTMPPWLKNLFDTFGGTIKTVSQTIISAADIVKSETEIKIKLTSAPGTSATIESVRKKLGTAKVKLQSEGFLGRTIPMNLIGE
jgi:TP901 family phage tail tape measure protein